MKRILKLKDFIIENTKKTNEPIKILCRSCAEYGSCKLDKKGSATKCRKFWEHRNTSDFETPKNQNYS